MKIVYLTAGAAGMVCGGCLHDNTLAAALRQAGEDVLLVPLYTPIRTDEDDVSHGRVFFGAINVALQQKWSLLRRTPRWVDRLLDQPRLLAWLTRHQTSTTPEMLGDVTCSMLQGELGRQNKELEKLVDWLADEAHPDVVHLSNTLLAGVARRIRTRLGVPLVCSLAGEDSFVERLAQPYRVQARSLLQERCQEFDALVAMNRYYAGMMSAYLGVPQTRVHVIPHGLNLTGHGIRPTRPEGGDTFTIGYLARICHDKGLHVLAEAFAILSQQRDLPPLRLKVAGYLASGDRSYFGAVDRGIHDRKLANRYEYVGQLDRTDKIAFLNSLDVFCLPTVHPESKGLPVLEALANAVPVVLPCHGSFPEIVQDTAGGLLFAPGNPKSLAQVLGRLARERGLGIDHGRKGQQAIVERYHARLMAERTRRLYRQLTGR